MKSDKLLKRIEKVAKQDRKKYAKLAKQDESDGVEESSAHEVVYLIDSAWSYILDYVAEADSSETAVEWIMQDFDAMLPEISGEYADFSAAEDYEYILVAADMFVRAAEDESATWEFTVGLAWGTVLIAAAMFGAEKFFGNDKFDEIADRDRKLENYRLELMSRIEARENHLAAA